MLSTVTRKGRNGLLESSPDPQRIGPVTKKGQKRERDIGSNLFFHGALNFSRFARDLVSLCKYATYYG